MLSWQSRNRDFLSILAHVMQLCLHVLNWQAGSWSTSHYNTCHEQVLALK